MGDQTAKAAGADSLDQLAHAFGGRPAWHRPDPVLARVDLPEHLDAFWQGLRDADVVERHR